MNKNKIVILIVGILVIIGVSFFVINRKDKKIIVEEKIATTTTPIEIKKEVVVSIKDTAWAVFQKYLNYNKDKNLNGVKSIVYKVNSICASEIPTYECKNRMNSAYSYGSILKKDDFKNVSSDKNQIILSTDFWTENAKEIDQYGRFRSIIFFIKGNDGEWKLLSFSPTTGNALTKASSTEAEVDAKLISFTEDKDKDGIADYVEQCKQVSDKSTCVQTDPTKRDTDGDGFWDGTQALMK
jgi:hypothetical protein